MNDERTLVAELATYISRLEAFDAHVEIHPTKLNRMDIVVNYKGNTLYTGEFKRPFLIEGKNPRNIDLVSDANDKASKFGSRFFITSNFNITILWDRSDTSRPLMSQDVEEFILPEQIKKDDDFAKPAIRSSLETYIQNITRRILDFKEGRVSTHYKPLGESFIMGLNSHLQDAAEEAIKYISNSLLLKWRKETSSLTTNDDDEKIRLAKYSLYVLSNKVMFYYYLKRTFTALPEIEEQKATSASGLKNIVEKAFERAQTESEDYGNVFESNEFDNIPFLSDELIKPVISLLRFYRDYSFDSMSQDILGNLYDRLISTDERYAFGQYFTPIPVVDMINALTIKKGSARVLDPACGSGTFLTRAFDLELKLMNKDDKTSREKVLAQLFGVDIARYPVHLATIALASKLKIANPSLYPQVIRSDFLDVKTKAVVPKYRWGKNDNVNTTRDFSDEERVVEFKPIDAVVGNLPYIETKQIDNAKRAPEQKKVLDFLTNNGFEGAYPSGLSDFHVYFWFYILPFLRDGSRVGFLTSDTWLNVGFGDDLKQFISKHFKILAIIESSMERWFEDALVNTVITILERCESKEALMNNEVSFFRITDQIIKIIPDLNAAIRIAKILETSKEGMVNEGIVLTRKVRQGSIDFSDVMGSKLYPYLRAPDVFFEYINLKEMTILKNVMDIKFGIKTGADSFFVVKDITDDYSIKDMKRIFGLNKGEADRIRVIKDGTGQPHLIEREYLRPFLKSPKEFTQEGKLLLSDKTNKMLVLIPEQTITKVKTHAKAYLQYGETKPVSFPYSSTPSVVSRNPWWKLSPIIKPDVVFPQGYSDKFIFPKANLLLHARLYFGVSKDKENTEVLYAYFNSSLFYPFPDFYGRTGGGGIVELKVYELENLKVPDPHKLMPYKEVLKTIMEKMEKRKIGNVYEEIWNGNGDFTLEKVKQDRLELDRTILKALSCSDADSFLIKWYTMLIKTIRERSIKASSIRKVTSKKGKDLYGVVSEVLKRIEIKHFFDDYVAANEFERTVEFSKGIVINMGNDLFSDSGGAFISVDGTKVYFKSKFDAKYCYYSLKCGVNIVNFPSEKRVREAVVDFEKDLRIWRTLILKEIQGLTSDEKTLEKLLVMCSTQSGLSDLLLEKS